MLVTWDGDQDLEFVDELLLEGGAAGPYEYVFPRDPRGLDALTNLPLVIVDDSSIDVAIAVLEGVLDGVLDLVWLGLLDARTISL